MKTIGATRASDMSSPIDPPPRLETAQAAWRGLCYAMVAVVSFGLMTPLARLAYDNGASPLTLVGLRTVTAVLGMTLLVLTLHRPLGLPRAAWLACGSLGLALFGATLCLFSAVNFIPVSTAVLLYYLFPLMVVTAIPLLQGKPVDPGLFSHLAIVFAGLALAIGPSLRGLDVLGIALALLGACSATAAFILIRTLVARFEMLIVVFWSSLVSCVPAILVVLIGGTLVVPTMESQIMPGWTAIGGVCLVYVVGMVAQFSAIRRAGAASVAAVFYLEPALAMAFSALLLGQHLTVWQLLGAAVVVICLAHLAAKKSPMA